MSKTVTKSLEGNILHAFGLAAEFVKTCPDSLWEQKFGGWPIWQQLFHPFASIDFFLRAAGEAEAAPLFQPGVAELKESPREAPAKAVIKEFMDSMQHRVLAYAAGLDDAALEQKHEGLSSRMGRDVTHAGALALIASHTMYHLGCCDAALRESGRPGVF